MNKKILILLFTICLILIIGTISIFHDITSRNNVSNNFKNDINLKDVNRESVNSLSKNSDYLSYTYNNSILSLSKYKSDIKNKTLVHIEPLNFQNGNVLVKLTKNQEIKNNEIQKGITIKANNDSKILQKIFIKSNGFKTQYGSKYFFNPSNFEISINEKNKVVYTGGFNKNYEIRIIKKGKYSLLQIFEYKNEDELSHFENFIKD